MAIKFTTTLYKATTKNVSGIVVPPELLNQLTESTKPPVVVTIAGYSWRSSVAKMGDRFMIAFSSEHRAATKLNGDETIEIEIALDDQPRDTPVPDDMRKALADADLAEAFQGAAPSRRKEFIRQVNEAKSPETRSRRIAKVIALLGA